MATFHLYDCFSYGLLNGWYPESFWTGSNSYVNTAAIWTVRRNTPRPPAVTDQQMVGNVISGGGTGHWVTGWRVERNSNGSYTVYIDPITEPQATTGLHLDRDAYYVTLQKWYGGTSGYSGDKSTLIGFVDLSGPLNLNTRSITCSWPNGLFTVGAE